jgi:hypothetical protein
LALIIVLSDSRTGDQRHKPKFCFSIRENRDNIRAARQKILVCTASLPNNSRAAQGAGVMTSHLSSARMLSQITHVTDAAVSLRAGSSCLKNDPQHFIPAMRLKPSADNLTGPLRVGIIEMEITSCPLAIKAKR